MSKSSVPIREQLTEPASASNLEYEKSMLTDFAPDIEAAFPAEFPECNCALACVEGQIPNFVHGVYYLNGPARFGFKDFRYQHWLDGDGMVSALHFDRDGVQFKNRYVQSTKLQAEQKAGEPLYRAFGTTFPGSRLNRANNGLESPVNVSVYPFGDRLLAFGEQGLPWELDPQTLETRGQFTFHGRLNDASPFSAHPKIDLHSGEMFNFGIFFSSHQPKLYLYCFGQEGLRYRKAVVLEYPCTVHDFTLSQNYAIFYISPYLLDIKRLLQGGATVMDSLSWEPERGSRLLVLSRNNGDLVASVPLGNRYCLHLINAFEKEDKLIIDVLEFDEPIYAQYQPLPHFFQDVSTGGPVRFSVDMQKQQVVNRVAIEYFQAPDFPAVDPRKATQPYEELWMLGISAAGNQGRKFFDQLVHANWTRPAHQDIYQAPRMSYLGGEPVFIGDPDSSQGVVLCQEFVAGEERSYFVLFDAHEVGKGPIARIPLNQALYLGFHATFRPATP